MDEPQQPERAPDEQVDESRQGSEWIRPQVTRFSAGSAETGGDTFSDGDLLS